MQFLYAKTKIFSFQDKINSLPKNLNTILPPIHIRIKPTNICNHNCWYCAYSVKKLQLGKNMNRNDSIPKEKMMELIKDIIAMEVKAVTFSGGGEPFCYPYLFDAVKKLAKTNVKFAVLTNGSIWNSKIAEIFASYGTWIRISMDGWDDKSYSFYRKVPNGEFKKVMHNIEKFKKLNGKCSLGICLIIDKKNASHIYSFVKRLKYIGVDSIKLAPCIVSNDSVENNIYHRDIFEKVKEHIKKTVADFADEKLEIFDSYHELGKNFKKDYTWCPYLQILPVIGADLNIYSCQDKAYNFNQGLIGSIKNQRFADFWFIDKKKFFKINPSLYCNHHCVTDAKNRLIIDHLNINRDHLEFV